MSLRWRNKEIGTGHIVARMLHRRWPNTAEAFMRWLVDMHHTIFKTGDTLIGGQLRTGVVVFGGERNEYEGEDPSRIEPELTTLFSQVERLFPDRGATKADAVHAAAFFLERFFMIHPFEDGNGRVARLATAVLLESRGFSFDQDRLSNCRHKKRYTAVLDFAHRHNVRNNHRLYRPLLAVDYLHHLKHWLAIRIQELPHLDEEPPD